MKYNKINYKGKELKRITERKVYNIIENKTMYNGLTIYMLPVEADPNSPWINGFFELTLENNVYMDKIDCYRYINECKYYNCNDAELGYYLKYYIESKDLENDL